MQGARATSVTATCTPRHATHAC